MKVNEFDVIKLKSGEEATILEIFEPTGDDILVHYDVELSSIDSIKTISDNDIDCVLYSASQNRYL
ncbi:MAG: hypothetical protein MR949_10870 [Veillonellaceae bacterium]|nr:hypothetical protein [Veillonellaceae bacterium]